MAVIVDFPGLSHGIYTHGNPSLFGIAVKHLDLAALDPELENKDRNHIMAIIMVYNSYHRGAPAPLDQTMLQSISLPKYLFQVYFQEMSAASNFN